MLFVSVGKSNIPTDVMVTTGMIGAAGFIFYGLVYLYNRINGNNGNNNDDNDDNDEPPPPRITLAKSKSPKKKK